MATTRQQALALVAATGAEIFDRSDLDQLDMTVWSPTGQVWRATGCHVIAAYSYGDKPAGWRGLLEDLRAGLDTCSDGPTCEVCYPSE